MNILITNIWLDSLSGTEVYVRDLAIALHKKGFNIEVFTTHLGLVSKEIEDAGINVVDCVDQLINVPDIIHAQHFIPTMEVICKFPNSPIIYFLHDRTHLVDHPPNYYRIVKYIAVDYNCLDRLIIDNKIEKEKTDVLYNWVDTDRFNIRSNFNERPIKAAVFSNYASSSNHFKIIQEACLVKGIKVDGIGIQFGNATKNPENVLQNYDIVFAKAKAAMEALATGASVIVCDFRGLGGLVSMENFDYYRKFNFGMKTMVNPIEKNLIIKEIEKYQASENIKTAKKIANEASFDKFLDDIIQIYKETVKNDSKTAHQPNSENQTIINDYKTLRNILFQNKLDAHHDELNKKDAQIINQENQIQNLIDELTEKAIQTQEEKLLLLKTKKQQDEYLIKIKNSLSYKLGRFLTFPLRKLYDIFN